MTRINSAISTGKLTDQHLIAELRELPRIFTAVKKRLEDNKPFNDIPKKFTLGSGHMKFFYNKCHFLLQRHLSLRQEYLARFNKNWTSFNEINIPSYLQERSYLWGCLYSPTQEERQLLIERISKRINESNQIPRYYDKPITKQQAIEILNS